MDNREPLVPDEVVNKIIAAVKYNPDPDPYALALYRLLSTAEGRGKFALVTQRLEQPEPTVVGNGPTATLLHIGIHVVMEARRAARVHRVIDRLIQETKKDTDG